jgi:hypothetical protein
MKTAEAIYHSYKLGEPPIIKSATIRAMEEYGNEMVSEAIKIYKEKAHNRYKSGLEIENKKLKTVLEKIAKDKYLTGELEATGIDIKALLNGKDWRL